VEGAELVALALRKTGRSWDALAMPDVQADDLDLVAFRAFRKMALERERMSSDALNVADNTLLHNLELLKDGLLTHAAVLLFHEKPQRYFSSAQVQIGYFLDDATLARMDIVEGPLMTMPDRVVDMLWSKYLSIEMSFERIKKGETLCRDEIAPVPQDALREAVTNAIMHRDYSSPMHTQIRVYDDKIVIKNAGELHNNYTFDEIMNNRISSLRNRLIASTFASAGMVEKFGTGITKIKLACKESNKPEPLLEAHKGIISITFFTDCTNGNGKLKRRVLKLLNENPGLTDADLARILAASEDTAGA
jgi:ATP-dependent DNA helicase RecG